MIGSDNGAAGAAAGREFFFGSSFVGSVTTGTAAGLGVSSTTVTAAFAGLRFAAFAFVCERTSAADMNTTPANTAAHTIPFLVDLSEYLAIIPMPRAAPMMRRANRKFTTSV